MLARGSEEKEDCYARKRQLSENRRALHGAELQHDRRRTQQHAHPACAPGAGRKTAGQSEGAQRAQKGPGAGTLMENRKRNVHLHVMVTPDELAAIHERMAEAGISNAGAYVRKMALNGYILHVDLAPIKELISLQRRCSNNLNQIAVHAHTYGVYPEEIDGLKRDYEKLWGQVSDILMQLSELVKK